ncbi:MAG: hypothetical protein RI906_127, partial [Pseudomonadota bacterium]
LNIPEELDVSMWPALQLLVIRNAQPRGFGTNHNVAFRHCRTSWYVILNPDLRLPEDLFPQLLSIAKALPKTGAVAPKIIDSDGFPEDSVRENLTPLSLMRRTLKRISGHRRLSGLDLNDAGDQFFWLAGMFLLFDSAAYRAVAGFDERFFLYCEDYDVCARLCRAGYQLRQVQTAQAIHEAQRDSQRSIKHLRWHVVSLLRVWTSSTFWWTLHQRWKPRTLTGG